MKKNPEHIVTEQTTLLPFLLENIGKSRNHVKGLLKRGQITVGGKTCTDYSRVLRPGDKVAILTYAPADRSMRIPVIYEDEELIVVNKPEGMLSIATDKESERTVYHIVTDYVKGHGKSERVFIVHRLDRETSGVMLFAKNERIKTALQDAWDELVTRREYIAVAEGIVMPGTGTVTSWLKQTKTLLVYSSRTPGDGKKAITNYHVRTYGEEYSLLDISLETGRKNQIRVHMSDLGYPVAGDKKYGAKTNPIGRLGLHASRLALTHPDTGEELVFEAKMPGSFKRVFTSESK